MEKHDFMRRNRIDRVSLSILEKMAIFNYYDVSIVYLIPSKALEIQLKTEIKIKMFACMFFSL